MKVALVLPSALWFSPFVRIYTRILEEENIDYGIISWNREGDDNPEGFQYNVPCAKGHSSAGWRAYRGYVKFIKKTITEQKFDKIIVFGPQLTCMLSVYLLSHFMGRYMIDYRDLSIEQKPGFKQLFAVMLKYSRANVISSPGFKRCLPKGNYYISHNFDVNLVKAALLNNVSSHFNINNGIDILTIGGIRDYSSNIEVVKALANKDGISCRFVGKGSVSQLIEEYCQNNSVKNVQFHGYYKKEEEASFIKDATFLNIFYPRIITHDTAMSNRFYNSLIYKRPMIVTKNTTQGDYAEMYKLGISIESCCSLENELKQFLKENYSDYCSRCNTLLTEFLKDQGLFEETVLTFINKALYD